MTSQHATFHERSICGMHSIEKTFNGVLVIRGFRPSYTGFFLQTLSHAFVSHVSDPSLHLMNCPRTTYRTSRLACMAVIVKLLIHGIEVATTIRLNGFAKCLSQAGYLVRDPAAHDIFHARRARAKGEPKALGSTMRKFLRPLPSQLLQLAAVWVSHKRIAA